MLEELRIERGETLEWDISQGAPQPLHVRIQRCGPLSSRFQQGDYSIKLACHIEDGRLIEHRINLALQGQVVAHDIFELEVTGVGAPEGDSCEKLIFSLGAIDEVALLTKGIEDSFMIAAYIIEEALRHDDTGRKKSRGRL